jgi:hypothetical protein
MYKLIFRIEYIPTAIGVKVSEAMSKCDLGIERISVFDKLELKTKTKPTKKYLKGLTEKIKEGYERDGGKVFDINLIEKS